MARPGRYSPELRERAVRMVFDHAGEYPSRWTAIRLVGDKPGCSTEVLRRCARWAERDAGQRRSRVGLTAPARTARRRDTDARHTAAGRARRGGWADVGGRICPDLSSRVGG